MGNLLREVREAERMLTDAQTLSPEAQHAMRRDLIDAFRVFWRSRPSEARFAEVTQGLVLLPAMLYIIATSAKRARDARR